MADFKIEILRHPTEEDWQWVKRLAMNTMGKTYLMDKEIRTMSTSLYTFVGPMGSQYNLICAGVLISIFPAFLVFILCQKQIYSGITQGAVKG